jgi:hypothetical protein
MGPDDRVTPPIWSVRGVPASLQRAAAIAAKTAGQTLGEWVSAALTVKLDGTVVDKAAPADTSVLERLARLEEVVAALQGAAALAASPAPAPTDESAPAGVEPATAPVTETVTVAPAQEPVAAVVAAEPEAASHLTDALAMDIPTFPPTFPAGDPLAPLPSSLSRHRRHAPLADGAAVTAEPPPAPEPAPEPAEASVPSAPIPRRGTFRGQIAAGTTRT